MLAGLLLLAATVAAHPFGPLTHKQHQRQTLIPGDDSQLSFIQTHITPSTNSGQPVRVTGATVLGVETFLGIPFGEARE